MIQLLQISDGQLHPSISAHILDGPDYGREWAIGPVQIQLTGF